MTVQYTSFRSLARETLDKYTTGDAGYWQTVAVPFLYLLIGLCHAATALMVVSKWTWFVLLAPFYALGRVVLWVRDR